MICFEITETAAIANLAHTIAFITSLKERGCRFHSMILAADLVPSLISRPCRSTTSKLTAHLCAPWIPIRADYSIVQAIINAAQALKKKTIAEFVENDAIHRCLKECGADYGQGYFFQKPVPFE